jgi:hypothetical protein
MSQVQLYVSSYLSAGETYQITPFSLSGGEYYIVNVSNVPSLILYTPLNGSLSTLDSKQGIENALVGYYASQGVYNDTRLDETDVQELLYLLDSYNGTRGEEFDCKTYIGLDRFPCVDLDSCWRACYTPVCQDVKLGGGDSFLDLIWAFANSSSYVDSNLSALVDAVAPGPDLNTPSKVDSLIALVDNIETNSLLMEGNGLFNESVVGFCNPLDYNLTYLDQAKVILDKKYMVFQLRAVDGTASEILSITNQRISLRNQIIESNSSQSMNASQDNPLIGQGLSSTSNILTSGVFILIVIVVVAVVFVANSIMRKRKYYR